MTVLGAYSNASIAMGAMLRYSRHNLLPAMPEIDLCRNGIECGSEIRSARLCSSEL